MNEDLSELLVCLTSRSVEFLIIGAHAVSFYARPRMTQDVDIWVGRSPENVDHLKQALDEFGAPIGDEGATRFRDLDRQMVRIGVPPNMVDILNFAGSTPFAEAYSRRIEGEFGHQIVPFPSKQDLIDMKREVGRKRDLADIESLESS